MNLSKLWPFIDNRDREIILASYITPNNSLQWWMINEERGLPIEYGKIVFLDAQSVYDSLHHRVRFDGFFDNVHAIQNDAEFQDVHSRMKRMVYLMSRM